jgi:RimJ/RimL family protein N-acetyltransferase
MLSGYDSLMLETDRLFLRPQTYDDIPNLIVLNSDPEVVRYTGEGALANAQEARVQFEERIMTQWQKYKMGRFSVALKDGTFLGWCGLKYHLETDEVDLGYRFMKKFWGKGYATEASRASLIYGFETLKIERIIAKAMPDNKNSIKVLLKLGMTFRGYHHDPTDPHPFILYDLKSSEWRG